MTESLITFLTTNKKLSVIRVGSRRSSGSAFQRADHRSSTKIPAAERAESVTWYTQMTTVMRRRCGVGRASSDHIKVARRISYTGTVS